MDFRFNYDEIRQQIDGVSIYDFDDNDQIVKDIKRRMHLHVDIILELEEEKRVIDRKIEAERMMLKKMADDWEI